MSLLNTQRTSGLLLHITSLPSPGGVGTLGAEAYAFVDFLQQAGQRWWQMLPIHPPVGSDSPYQTDSAFAGNSQLIDLRPLRQKGWLTSEEASVDRRQKEKSLRRAWHRFHADPRAPHASLARFRIKNGAWLQNYALFRALASQQDTLDWTRWPAPLRTRQPRAMTMAAKQHAQAIAENIFIQYLFFQQWESLRAYARERGVGFIGDVPIFIAHESADVWSHPELFLLDRSGQATHVAGVPPDYFSKTGQRWGNPLYRWDRMKKNRYRWWRDRLTRAFECFDVVRLDHFIGFVRYWKIPSSCKTAIQGQYEPGPGAHFFETIRRELPKANFIAEDLGNVVPSVRKLRDRFELPGMRVIQFSYSPNDSEERPYTIYRHCVFYSGTHDNNTLVGWLNRCSPKEKKVLLDYTGAQPKNLKDALIRVLFSSAALTVIMPVQDVLGVGEAARMNSPGLADGNWRWRLKRGQLTSDHARWLKTLTKTYGR